MVPVKRYDVSLDLHKDILAPLMQAAARFGTQPPAAAAAPDLHQHIQELSDLAAKISDVVSRINAIDPKVLAHAARDKGPDK
jgi:hypothetical protein